MNRPHHVGADIRALRVSRGMKLAKLSGLIKRSVGWLSQVERGKTEPGLADLREIAKLFEIPISFFFRNDVSPEEERGIIVRKSARASLGSREQGLVEELLSPNLSGDFEMIIAEFSPGASGGYSMPRQAQEGGYLVSGDLTMIIDGKRFELSAGDSFQFQNQTCTWENCGDATAVVVWVIAPPVY